MIISSIDNLVNILQEFESRKISYILQRYLSDSISLCVTVPGERWEIDINQFGEIQIEIFKSNGEIYDSTMLDNLFERFTD